VTSTEALERLQARRSRRSGYRDDRTVQEVADEWAADLVDGAADGSLDAESHYGEVSLRAERFVLAGGGPGVDITFVLDSDGEVDYAVLDYVEMGARAQAVLLYSDAEVVYAALRRDPE
jgi:hypothetical protein